MFVFRIILFIFLLDSFFFKCVKICFSSEALIYLVLFLLKILKVFRILFFVFGGGVLREMTFWISSIFKRRLSYFCWMVCRSVWVGLNLMDFIIVVSFCMFILLLLFLLNIIKVFFNFEIINKCKIFEYNCNFILIGIFIKMDLRKFEKKIN